jgi:diguanylate cyclase (GGDEF)-like protein/PAS domain S-box-containing protein
MVKLWWSLKAHVGGPRLLVGSAWLLLVATVAFVTVYALSETRTAEARHAVILDTAARHAGEMADVIARQMEAVIKGVDLSLLQLCEVYRQGNPRTFEPLVSATLAALQDHGIQGIVITDARGHIVYSSISPKQQGIFLGDRDYFVAAAAGKDQIVIGTPVRSRLLQSWSFVMARPILAHGRFNGIIVIGMTPEYFAKQLFDPRLLSNDIVAIIHSDGSYLARSQALDRALGTKVPPDSPFLAEGSTDHGIYSAQAAVDRRDRVYAWQRVSGSGVVILVGLDKQTLLVPIDAENDRSMRVLVLVAASLLLLGGGLSLLLLRTATQQRRLIASDARYREALATSRANEQKLRLAASMFAHSHEAIIYCDPAGRILDANEGFVRLTGYGRDEVIGRDFGFLDAGRQGADFYNGVRESLRLSGNWRGEVLSRNKSGEVFVELLNLSAIAGEEGVPAAYVGIFSDITALKENERRFMQLAHTDALTGLPNRTLLIDRLNQAVRATARQREFFGVVFVDLDGFKPINDTFGHQAGDEVLIEVARRLRHCMRAADTACRLGGDEFVLLLRNLASAEETMETLDRVRREIARPYRVGNENIGGVTASVGLACFPKDAIDAEGLIAAADDAMYEAKRAARGVVQGATA